MKYGVATSSVYRDDMVYLMNAFQDLTNQVNDAIAHGCVPVGSPQVIHMKGEFRIIQALIKK